MDCGCGNHGHEPLSPARPAVFLLRKLLRLYQLTLSSLIGRQCRHLPTCSAYMDEALARHGLWVGLFMGLARLSRCHPWGTAGFDPVPELYDKRISAFQPWRHGRWFFAPKPVKNCGIGDESGRSS
ncbi:membrane protein insertion efficiency factor YidD [Beijerinckia mobilis]|uniref:membrane protein insertion efficiency factor YidD n=1 Tax=Beijerinckia mobilis TaxID=231434 RepID=UPI000A05936E